jgi:hypothetical protein
MIADVLVPVVFTRPCGLVRVVLLAMLREATVCHRLLGKLACVVACAQGMLWQAHSCTGMQAGGVIMTYLWVYIWAVLLMACPSMRYEVRSGYG